MGLSFLNGSNLIHVPKGVLVCSYAFTGLTMESVL